MSVAVGNGTYIAETAVLIGDVLLSDGVSVFDHAVLRGDLNSITIGKDSNVQDNVSIHVDRESPADIGRGVSLGHNSVVHGSVIEDYVIVGMGAIVLNGARIASGSVIGAGSVVTQNFRCSENSLIIGVPAKVVKSGDEYREYAIRNYTSYTALRDRYLSGSIERHIGASQTGKRS